MELIANQQKIRTLLHGIECSSVQCKRAHRITSKKIYTQAVCKLSSTTGKPHALHTNPKKRSDKH